MHQKAEGQFEITATREPPYDDRDGLMLARTRYEKRFQGDLEGTSTVEMLSAGNAAAPGSAGYVAMERVDGRLHGRSGSFVLQHSGAMINGDGALSVNVVPGTGIGELAGLRGRFHIEIRDGRHFYAFEYTLDAPPTDG